MALKPKMRSDIYDNAKFFLIFAVVLGHFADWYASDSWQMKSLYFFIYSFHMPAFIWISGLFSKKSIQEKRYARVFSYLVLYFLIKVCMFLSKRLFLGEGEFSLFSEDHVPWFAFALAVFFLITVWIQNISPMYCMVFFIAVGCFAGYDAELGDTLVLSRILVYYPFYLAGYYLDPERIAVWSRKIWVRIMGWITLAALAYISLFHIEAVYWLRPLLTGRNPFVNLKEYAPYGGIFRFVYYIAVFCIVFSILAVVPAKKRFFTRMGRNTLPVYAFHHSLIYAFYGLGGEGLLCFLTPWMPHIWIVPLSLLIVLFLSMDIWAKIIRILTRPPCRKECSPETGAEEA